MSAGHAALQCHLSPPVSVTPYKDVVACKRLDFYTLMQ